MKNFLFLFVTTFFISCGNTGTGSVSSETIEKRDPNGLITERQQMVNGQQTGTFVEYFPEKGLPKKVITYNNGQLDGPVMEFNDRGQVTKMTNYKNGQLDGKSVTYKFGRITESSSYKNGKLDGTYLSYFSNTDKLQKEAEYKNGIQDGIFKQYNEEGKVVLEYVYDNGEVVKGGMVE